MSTTTTAATKATKRVSFKGKAAEHNSGPRKRKQDDQVGDIIKDLITGKDPQFDDAALQGVESHARTLLAAKTKALAKQQGVNDLTTNPGKIPNNVFVKSSLALALPTETADAETTANMDELVALNAHHNERARAIQLKQATHEVSLLQKKLRELPLSCCNELATGFVAYQTSLLDVAATELGDMTNNYLAGATTHCTILSHTPDDPLWSYLHMTKETLACEIARSFLFRNGHLVINGACLNDVLLNTPIFFDNDGKTLLRFRGAIEPPTTPTETPATTPPEEGNTDNGDNNDNHQPEANNDDDDDK